MSFQIIRKHDFEKTRAHSSSYYSRLLQTRFGRAFSKPTFLAPALKFRSRTTSTITVPKDTPNQVNRKCSQCLESAPCIWRLEIQSGSDNQRNREKKRTPAIVYAATTTWCIPYMHWSLISLRTNATPRPKYWSIFQSWARYVFQQFTIASSKFNSFILSY